MPNLPTVGIVGAGPGDPGLLTVRAVEWLQNADVVIHDALVSRRILALARPDAQLIEAGKRHGCKLLTQQQINALLVEHARNGRRVVRLKGGDPTLFGRISEEIRALREAGISFEIVPGVSSGTATAAVAGIGLTDRLLSSTVVFATGHEVPDKPTGKVDWAQIARLGGTIVVFMGLRRLPAITAELLAAGVAPQTPVLVAEWATMPRQRVVVAPLCEIVERVAKANLSPPATIVIGEVVQMASKPGAPDNGTAPLAGQTVVVTRPRGQAEELSAKLEELGAAVISVPAIEIVAPSSFGDLDQALRRLPEYDWIVFTSANAVRPFFDRLRALKLDARTLAGCRIAAVGAKTAEALAAAGLLPDLVPARANAEELATAIRAQGKSGERVLFPAGSRSRETLVRRLSDAGFVVDRVVCYESRDVTDMPPEAQRELAHTTSAWVTAMSPATARAARRLLRSSLNPCPRLRWVTISPLTTSALRELGEEDIVEAKEASAEGLVQAILEAVREEREETEHG